MKKLKTLVFGVAIGLLLGLWFGVNIGRDKALYSNPFADASTRNKLMKTSEKVIHKSGELIEEGGEALQKISDQTQQ